MPRLDNPKRIVKEDYPQKYHDLIHQLAYVINSFMEQSTGVINGNIDFSNLNQDIVTFDMVVDANGTPIGNNLFKSSVSSPRGTDVIRAFNKDDSSSFVSSCPFISYTTQTNTQLIKIDNITGLDANTTYSLTVITKG